ncbi:MAG: putative quinol monooxygenase [Rhodospirillaceae bacterium]|nr:putative quinol monooxygenase [Rhodospirillaceae bacterium]
MILISGLIELAEADIDTMKVAAITMALETRMETGCIQYAFYQDIENPAIFRVFEEWESMDALQAHFGSPHMKVFRETLSQAAIVRRDLKKYSVTHSAPLT